jgi:dolichol-phosphate mannosyltransferase
MPTYNEAPNLPRMAELVLGLPIDGLHLKIVDDSSPDGTGRIAEELAEKHNWDGRRRMSVLHRTEKDGLGRAYVAGMSAALDEVLATFSAENELTESEFELALGNETW